MESGFNKILDWLKAYKKKYYQNLLIKGIILSTALLISIFLLFNSIEYTLRLAGPLRAVLLFVFLLVLLVVIWKWVITPITQLLQIKKQLSHEEAARQIGAYFPEISDKLLNTIQLYNENKEEGSLITASIAQRTKELSLFSFSEAVDFTENRQYLKFLIPPLIISIILFMFIPQLFTEGTERIINFKKEYVPEAPFKFKLVNKDLKAFKNEDFSLTLDFEGSYRPKDAYLVIGERRIKMQNQADQHIHTFNNIQQDIPFHFEAAGFRSSPYKIDVRSRPSLKGFNITLLFPPYLKKEKERLENGGNLIIPEGTTAQWQFSSMNTDSLSLYFTQEDSLYTINRTSPQLFDFKKKILNNDIYKVNLQNAVSTNKEEIKYTIEVIKDQYPTISLESFQDTTLYNFMVLGGNISDDYGLTHLKVYYQIIEDDNSNSPSFKSIALPINNAQSHQSYYFPWSLDSLLLSPGSKINYYLQVWDNDGVNGPKSTKTNLFTFHLPNEEDVAKMMDNALNETKDQITSTRNETKDIKESLEEIEDQLKGKKQVDWQDKNKIENLIKKKEALNEALETLKNQNRKNNLQKERFGEQHEKIKEKAKELQKLMDELLDEETKKLYNELKRLLEEEKDISSVQQQLSKINNKERNLEKELERALELFKRLQFDHKLDDLIQDLDKLASEQQKLSEETDQVKKESSEMLKDKQEALSDSFEKIQEDIMEIQKLNQDLKNPNPLQNTSKEEELIEREQKESKEALEKNKPKQSAKHQQKAAEQLNQLSQRMAQMQSNMEMNMMQENLDNLEDVLDNLVKLSFNQEALMNSFKDINQTDPRFVNLSQQQLKLKEDAKIIEDSLVSLANRVFQIQSFVMREIEKMNSSINSSLDELKERNQAKAISDQQFSMTSMNNLALLLNDVLKQMQQQMADAMGQPQKGKGNQPSLSLGDLQEQLNQKISELKKSGKSGRTLSEELAQLAAEQEEIRRMLQSEMEKGGDGGGNGKFTEKQLIEKMEKTEADLVNKELTEETIERQQEILTRLLESENAMREREKEEEREAERPNDYEKIAPKAFEDYIRAKEKEIELLKSIPPKLNPYYLQEVNEYFKRLRNTTI